MRRDLELLIGNGLGAWEHFLVQCNTTKFGTHVITSLPLKMMKVKIRSHPLKFSSLLVLHHD
ncbi:hypothetical protein Pint_02698 [Pistacia integerrima]|uniref:Uncharacterized protein n=1 Tax=Pistacia integerrima TaxID=434235 RepID=A0ACC0ZJY9_9ROSI|nr:hypothetical protein Pint_02698 [Pistacia integerrima]